MALPTSRVASSSRSIPLWARTFHSSSSSSAPRGAAAPAQPSAEIQKARATVEKADKPPLMQGWKPYDFSEPPFLGTVEILKIQETWELLDKVRENDKLLRAQATPFKPPTNPVRITQNIMPGQPNHKITQKAISTVPVSSLPLSSPEAVHRLKLLAGPRWTPGRKDVRELDIHPNAGFNRGPHDIGKDGWLYMSCDKFQGHRMNRKFLSDTLERLVEAANDESTGLSTDIPLDTRHLIAKRKRLNYGENRVRVVDALASRTIPGSVGHVRGYPVEWLSEEVMQSSPKLRKQIGRKKEQVTQAESTGEGESNTGGDSGVRSDILPAPSAQTAEMSV